jgi:hypothetical protein
VARRRTAVAALAGAFALVAPQGASAQTCQVPKAWQTAAVQLEYDVAVELGLAAQHTRQLAGTPSGALPAATVTYLGQRFVSSGYVVIAAARFGTTVAGSPPDCRATARRRR